MAADRQARGSFPSLSTAGWFVVFGLFWSALTLIADAAIAQKVAWQLYALTYTPTTGKVTVSQLKKVPGSEKPSSRVQIEYVYSVGGKEYSGNRYRYGKMSGNRRVSEQTVAAHPVGSPIAVHYAPASPSESVIVVGLESLDLFVAMCMTPFNLVMAGCWLLGGRAVYRWRFPSPTGGAKVWDEGSRVRIRLAPSNPVVIGMLVVGVAALVLTLVVGIVFGGAPTTAHMLLAWAVILGCGGCGYWYERRRQARGDFDLVLDLAGRLAKLPRTFGRSEAVVVPFDRIASIAVEEVERRASRGRIEYAYAPTLVLNDKGPKQILRLVDWPDEKQARVFAGWLRERVGFSGPKVAPTTSWLDES